MASLWATNIARAFMLSALLHLLQLLLAHQGLCSLASLCLEHKATNPQHTGAAAMVVEAVALAEVCAGGRGAEMEHEWSKMADNVQSLAQLENQLYETTDVCIQLYETTDSTTQPQAEEASVEITNSFDCLSKCQMLTGEWRESATELNLP